ncbi:MAG: ABC transporter permease [Propionibacteriaceae bacterium]|nr:ABC transporter permease [Propionibacteriaceae bacterium]
MSADSTSSPRLAVAPGPAGQTAAGRAALDGHARPPRGPWQLAFGRLRRAKLAMAGIVILGVLVLLAVFANVVAPEGQDQQDLFNIKAPISAKHWLGTDELGRDVVSRLIYGGRVSLAVGLSAALVSTALGIVAGALSGYYGGWVDGALMRFIDVVLAFPSIFLLLIVFSFDSVGRSATIVSVYLGLFGWMYLARVIRGEFMALKQREFVEAARAVGAPDGRIIIRHLLPNVIAAIIVATTLSVAYNMLAEATLSFLGFGVSPSTPTWGNMLTSARTSALTDPHLVIAPGLVLTVAVLAVNFIGDGLRDAFDPKGR